jgi:serine protease Do
MYFAQLIIYSLLVTGVAQARDLSPREIYEQASPAVVMVMGYPNNSTRGSGGTGSIIQSDGLVLTNAHVIVDEATGRPFPRLTVYLKPDRVTGDQRHDLSRGIKARVVAYSQPLDLALLRLDGVKTTLPVVSMNGSETTHIGDRVVAIGHPEQGGLWTLTTGTISSEFDNFNGVIGKHVFQTETGLNRGNSGGPLLNQQGQMIGVNTAIARVAADGMPIASISFSLKSAVAKQWIGEQGQGNVSSEQSMPARPAQPTDQTGPELPQQSDVPAKPVPQANATPKVLSVEPSRPYNLDELVSDRAKAEADLDNMIIEMRGRMKGR